MAGQNDFLIFDENSENILTQALYETDDDREDGFRTGLARSNVTNKVLRQVSIMASALGELIKTQGGQATDSSLANLVDSLKRLYSIKNYYSDAIYAENDVVTNVNDNNFKLYLSLSDNNTGNPLTDTTKWQEVELGFTLPSQSGNSGKYLTTDGTDPSWGSVTQGHTWCTTKPTTTSSASSTNPAVIVENYKNGASWYYVFSDKWCIQGSTFTGSFNQNSEHSLLKTFADTNYTIVGNANNSADNSLTWAPKTKATNKFTGESSRSSAGNLTYTRLSWIAYGYVN